MAEAPKPPRWKRLWSVVTTLDSVRSIVLLLSGLGGGSAAVARVDATSRFSQFAVEWWATVIAAFSFGAVGAIGLAMVAVRTGPHVARWWRRNLAEPPYLSVRPCGGKVAVLEIENSGGRCALKGWGRILSVEGGQLKKRDSYPMLWRMDWQRAYVAAPDGAVVRRGRPALKLSIAEHDTVTVGALEGVESILAIDGGPGRVDAIHYNPRSGSPTVTIEVRIESDPPLRTPFRQVYSVQIPPDYQRVVELREVTP